MLSPATWPRPRYGNTARSIRALVVCLPIPCGEFVYGVSKVFIRSPRSVWELEQLRAERLNQLAALVQEAWHRHKRQNCSRNPSNKCQHFRYYWFYLKKEMLFKLKCITHVLQLKKPHSRMKIK